MIKRVSIILGLTKDISPEDFNKRFIEILNETKNHGSDFQTFSRDIVNIVFKDNEMYRYIDNLVGRGDDLSKYILNIMKSFRKPQNDGETMLITMIANSLALEILDKLEYFSTEAQAEISESQQKIDELLKAKK